jgi:hypothetical protein
MKASACKGKSTMEGMILFVRIQYVVDMDLCVRYFKSSVMVLNGSLHGKFMQVLPAYENRS